MEEHGGDGITIKNIMQSPSFPTEQWRSILCKTVFANCFCRGLQESREKKGENSRTQSACDEDTHRVDCIYKETRIKKRCFSLSLCRCPQSSLSLASNYAVWLVSAFLYKPEKKEEGCVHAKWKRDIFLNCNKSQQNTIKTWGVSVFPPFVFCLFQLFSLLFLPL